MYIKIRTTEEINKTIVIKIFIGIFIGIAAAVSFYFLAGKNTDNLIIASIIIGILAANFVFTTAYSDIQHANEEEIEKLMEYIKGIKQVEKLLCDHLRNRNYLTKKEYYGIKNEANDWKAYYKKQELKNKFESMCKK